MKNRICASIKLTLMLFLLPLILGGCETPTTPQAPSEITQKVPAEPLPVDSPVYPPRWLIGEWGDVYGNYTIEVNGANIIFTTPFNDTDYYRDYDPSILIEITKTDNLYQVEINSYGFKSVVTFKKESVDRITYKEKIDSFSTPSIIFKKK